MFLSDILGGMDVYVYPGKSLLLGQPKTKNDNKGQLKEKGLELWKHFYGSPYSIFVIQLLLINCILVSGFQEFKEAERSIIIHQG